VCLGTLGTVDRVWREEGVTMVRVRFRDRVATVCSMIVPEINPGERVVVQAGYVVRVLAEDVWASADALRTEINAEATG